MKVYVIQTEDPYTESTNEIAVFSTKERAEKYLDYLESISYGCISHELLELDIDDERFIDE